MNTSCTVESPEKGKLKRKPSSRRHTLAKKRKALKKRIAKDTARHTENSAYAITTLKLKHLEHSTAAYAGNLTRQDLVPLPRELGCMYKLLRYTPG